MLSRAMHQYQRRDCDGLNVECLANSLSGCMIKDPQVIEVLTHRVGVGIIACRVLKMLLTLYETWYVCGVVSFQHISCSQVI